MSDFPHLKLPFKVDGVIRPSSQKYSPKIGEITRENKENRRQQHGEYLKNSANNLIDKWNNVKVSKRAEGIELPNDNDIPVFLKVDTAVFNLD